MSRALGSVQSQIIRDPGCFRFSDGVAPDFMQYQSDPMLI